MALGTLTVLDSVIQTASTDTISIGTVGPTGSALLIALVAGRNGSPVANTGVSASFSITGSWQAIAGVFDAGGAPVRGVYAWYAFAAATPGTGAVTAQFAGDLAAQALVVMEITGAHATTPVPQSSANSDSEGDGVTDPTLTLSSPAAGSAVVGFIATRHGQTPTLPGGHSLVQSENITNLHINVSEDFTSPSGTVDWSGLNNGSDQCQAYLAFEIAEAAGGDASPIQGRRRGGIV